MTRVHLLGAIYRSQNERYAGFNRAWSTTERCIRAWGRSFGTWDAHRSWILLKIVFAQSVLSRIEAEHIIESLEALPIEEVRMSNLSPSS